MSRPYQIHVLYEYGPDFRPHGSAYLRLLRPLSHPMLRGMVSVTFGLDYLNVPVDAVIVDRLWRPDISLDLARELLVTVRRNGAKLIYALDDDFLTLDTHRASWFTVDHREVAWFLLHEADLIIVTTAELAKRFVNYNAHIRIIPNFLDERLLGSGRLATPFMERRITIGYMGTLTHDDDFLLMLPALRKVVQKYSDRVRVQLIGAIAHANTWPLLSDLPLYVLPLSPIEAEYPLFVPWFTSRVQWDIAISPLCDDDFNRCKSDIKFLDYSAIGAAGIYSRVPAYMGSVVHGETGWLAENTTEAWVEALETLILDASLRRRIASNARQYLYSERIVARAVQYWVDAFESLSAQR